MTVQKSQINSIKDFDVRTILLGLWNQIDANNQANGIPWLTPANITSPAGAAPPNPPGISVTGGNGNFTIQITAAQTSINKAVYFEISYSTSSSFTSNVTTLPVTNLAQIQIPSPGTSAYFRVRASFDKTNWSAYANFASVVAAGLQSSAASEPNVPLNQTNYANVDSVAAGADANVRVYGSAGPNTMYPSVKGAQETILPSATIIGVPFGTNPVVAYDSKNYQLRATLPEVFADSMTPTGAVSVVESGAVTLPVVDLVLGSGGAVIGWNVVSQGNGLTAPVTLTINTSTGTGATPGTQTIQNGKLISIAPGNPGSGYAGGDSVTVSGGVFEGASGGGRSIGGNGGRFVYNDGTTS